MSFITEMNGLHNTRVLSALPLSCIAALLIVSLPLISAAQWQKIYQEPNHSPAYQMSGIYFFHEMRGIVGIDGNPYYGIIQTTDGGATWRKASTPSNSGKIRHITMTDSLNGWASVEGDISKPGLWRTTDGGWTWTAVGPNGQFGCVYQTPSAVVASTRVFNQQGAVSLDGGQTFQSNQLTFYNGIDFMDDKFGVVAGFGSSPWKRSTDGGISWQQIVPTMNTETWSIYAEKQKRYFYAAGEDDPFTRVISKPSQVVRSTDLGQTWQTLYTFPFFTTGHISGKDNRLYVQVEKDAKNGTYDGFYRSDDAGITWKSVGGPLPDPDNDCRFWVTGCNGGVVYAFDDRFGIWKTRNGGDGSIFEPTPEPVVSGLPITLSSRICDSVTTNITINNQYCDSLYLIGIDFPDDTLGLLSSGAIQFLSAGFPRTIGTDKQTSITLRWSPSHLSHRAVSVLMRIRLRYASPVYPTIRDTSFVITLESIADPPSAVIAPNAIDMGSIPFCVTRDTLITITNSGCDTLFVNRISSSMSAFDKLLTVSGQPLAFPLVILPNESVSFRLTFTSTIANVYPAALQYHFTHQGIDELAGSTYTITVTNDNVYRMEIQPPVTRVFDEILTRCDQSKIYPLRLSNPGCLNLTVLSVDVIGAPAANISASVAGGIPHTLAKSENADLTITVTPSVLGVYNGFIHIRYQFEGEAIRDTLLAYSLTVNYGTRILSVEPPRIDMGSIRLCITKDTIITLRNLGCDTLDIRSVSLASTPPFFTIDQPGSMILPPGETTSFRVHLDPDYSGDIAGGITISSTTDSTDPRIVDLRAYIIPTDTVTLRLEPMRNTFHAGDTITIRLVSESDVYLSSGLRDVTFGVNFNGDLLTIIENGVRTLIPGSSLLAGVSSRTLPEKREKQMYFLQGDPFLRFTAGQPLAEFRFFVTLTDTTTAFFYLSDIALNGSDTNYSRCTLGLITARTSAELQLLCGDTTLIEFMRTGKVVGLRTVPAYPNPLTSSSNYRLTVEYESASDEIVTITIVDAAGRAMQRQSALSRKGKNSIVIDASSLASGTYYFTLRTESDSMRAGSFILQR